MKQSIMFEIASVPRLRNSVKKRLHEFCRENRIYTHSAPHMGKQEQWSAVWLSEENKNRNVHDLIAEECEYLEDIGQLVTGPTEREAVETLCRNVGTPFKL